jgi:hypothetical protein
MKYRTRDTPNNFSILNNIFEQFCNEIVRNVPLILYIMCIIAIANSMDSFYVLRAIPTNYTVNL